MSNLTLLCCNASPLFLAWFSMENSLFLSSSHQPFMIGEMIPHVPSVFHLPWRSPLILVYRDVIIFLAEGLAPFLEVQCLIYYTNWGLDSDEKMLWRTCEVVCILIATTPCKLWSRVSLLTDIHFVVHYSPCTSVSNSNPALLSPCNYHSLSADTNSVIRFCFISQAINEQK